MKMAIRSALFLLALCAVALAAVEKETILSFKKFLKDFDKSYDSPSEYTKRLQIFQDNLKRIDELNSKTKAAKFGITKFADLTPEEFKNTYLSKVPAVKDPSWPVAPLYSEEEIKQLPTSFDWRTKGAVTPVKDQGQCGKQNLVDCDHECMQYEGEQVCDGGCNGGLMPNAFHYVMQNGGIDSEESYPYVAFDQNCAYKPANKAASIKNWTMIASDEDQMAAYMVKNGPISIAVDAELWQFYFGGIFDFPWCGSTLDHGVTIVGYDVGTDLFDQPMQFWWVKNSWGSSWGYDGYIKLERGNGECGDNLFPCAPIA